MTSTLWCKYRNSRFFNIVARATTAIVASLTVALTVTIFFPAKINERTRI